MKLGKYLAGAISGLTFGLLFAPKKGEDLRADIKKGGKKSKQEALSVLVQAFKEAGIEALDEAKKIPENETVEAAIGHSKDKMREYFAQIQETGYDIAERAKEKLEEMQAATMEAAEDLKDKAVKKAKGVQKSAMNQSKKKANQLKKKLEDILYPSTTTKVKKAIKKPVKKATRAVKKTVKQIKKKVAKK